MDVPCDATFSLYSANKFAFSGGSLTVGSFVQVDDSFTIGGGASLAGATVLPGAAGPGISITGSSATLDGVTLNADIAIRHEAQVTVRNGLTLNGVMQVRKRGGDEKWFPFADTWISFSGTQRLDGRGEVVLGVDNSNLPSYSVLAFGAKDGTFSVGPGITIRGTGAYVGGATFLNEGTVVSEGSLSAAGIQANYGRIGVNGENHVIYLGGTLFDNFGRVEAENGGRVLLSGTDMTNSGIIEANEGGSVSITVENWNSSGTVRAVGSSTIDLGGRWSSSGTIRAIDGSRMDLGGRWSSSGVIRLLGNAVLYLNGYCRLSDSDVDTAEGIVYIGGTLDNRGSTLELSATTGSWRVVGTSHGGGTIIGGVIEGVEGAGLMVADDHIGRLDGVTLNADVMIPPGTYPTNKLVVTNGLTFNGVIDVQGDLVFSGSQMLGGGGRIIVSPSGGPGGGYNGYMWCGNDDLVIGPGITFEGLFRFVGNGAVRNHGTIQSHGNLPSFNASIGVPNFTNLGTVEVVGGGSRLAISSAEMTNEGTLAASGSGTLTVDHVTNFTSESLSGGIWRVDPNSTIRVMGADIVMNATTIVLSGANSHFYRNANADALARFETNSATGSFSILGGRDYSTTGTFANSGTLTIGAGSAFTVEEDYSQPASGVLDLELALAGESAQLVIRGAATLEGVLNVTLADGFTPSAGDTFEIMTFGSIVTDTLDYHGLNLGNGLMLKPVFAENSLTLTTVSQVLGDVNVDGGVNGLDVDPFTRIVRNGPHNAAADMNQDGVVNGLDVDLFVGAILDGSATAAIAPLRLSQNDLATDIEQPRVTSDTLSVSPMVEALDNLASELHRHVRDSHENHDHPRLTHHGSVERAFGRRSRLGRDRHRASTGEVIGRMHQQFALEGDWQAATQNDHRPTRRSDPVCRPQESKSLENPLGEQTALVSFPVVTGFTRVVGGRKILGRQVGRHVHAVMQDAANLDLIVAGEAQDQEVTRAANSTESSIDMITAVPKVIGAGDARDFLA